GGAEGGERGGHGGDAVRLLDAQLGGLGDHGFARGVGGERGEQRQLVDGAHRQLAADARAVEPGGGGGEVGDGLAAHVALVLHGDPTPHGAEGVEHAGAGGVHADAPHGDAAAGDEQR